MPSPSRAWSPPKYDGMDQDLIGIWATPGGDKVAWFTDPEGNNVSLTEFV